MNVETGHAQIGYGKFLRPVVTLVDKERDYGTAGTHHIAITDYGEPDVLGTADIVGSSKQLVGSELGGTIKIDGGTCLVGRKGHHMLYTGGKSSLYHILRTVYIGFDALFGIVFSGIHLLDGGCMDNHVHSFASPRQAFEVTDITDKETQLRILMTGIFLFQLKLLQLIAGVNNDFLYLRIITENGFHKLLSEGTRSSGNQYGFIVKHYNEKFYSSIYSHG